MTIDIKTNQNNDWLRKKLLERQAQQQSQVSNQQQSQTFAQNIKPQEQTSQVQSADKAASANPPPNAALPWGSMMGSLGLSPQGSKEADLSAIGEKIAQMKTQATDPAKKSQIDSLEKQYEGYKAVAANMQQPSQNQTASAASQMTGATQLGLNNLALIEIKKRQPEGILS
jgi:hypothetical protein